MAKEQKPDPETSTVVVDTQAEQKRATQWKRSTVTGEITNVAK